MGSRGCWDHAGRQGWVLSWGRDLLFHRYWYSSLVTLSMEMGKQHLLPLIFYYSSLGFSSQLMMNSLLRWPGEMKELHWRQSFMRAAEWGSAANNFWEKSIGRLSWAGRTCDFQSPKSSDSLSKHIILQQVLPDTSADSFEMLLGSKHSWEASGGPFITNSNTLQKQECPE